MSALAGKNEMSCLLWLELLAAILLWVITLVLDGSFTLIKECLPQKSSPAQPN